MHKFCDPSEKRIFFSVFSFIHLNLIPPFLPYCFSIPSLLFAIIPLHIKIFPHHVLCLLYLYPLPSFLLHSFHIPFICTSLLSFLTWFHNSVKAGLYFPDILAMAEESLWFPVIQLWCVGFSLSMKWTGSYLCFNWPFDSENEEISHLTYVVFYSGSYIGGGS